METYCAVGTCCGEEICCGEETCCVGETCCGGETCCDGETHCSEETCHGGASPRAGVTFQEISHRHVVRRVRKIPVACHHARQIGSYEGCYCVEATGVADCYCGEAVAGHATCPAGHHHQIGQLAMVVDLTLGVHRCGHSNEHAYPDEVPIKLHLVWVAQVVAWGVEVGLEVGYGHVRLRPRPSLYCHHCQSRCAVGCHHPSAEPPCL